MPTDETTELQKEQLTFAGLPTELRFMIRSHTMLPQVIKASSSASEIRVPGERSRLVVTARAQATVPKMLHVCRESRSVGLKTYRSCFGRVFKHPIYVAHFDALYILEHRVLCRFLHPDIQDLKDSGPDLLRSFDVVHRTDLASVQNLVVGP
ncbi:uncharacterized protein PAC_01116 [Phialocephala subalpina]|uniref:2EXR domain-containing protein n=1 Tax=Phialocephala subalpina TaxID=576137 RepID=A0A1L7WEN2_9HELO|nr:uncharacterized protein PAC_01116 [Phialocephala subalpina]